MTTWKEHRKHKRLQVPKGVFVGIGPHFTKVGRLTDLSTDGLAFRYVGNSKPSSGSHADIFTLEGDRFFTNLQIKIVSDIEVSENGPPTSIIIRRCSVKFGELTQSQTGQLEYFIQDHPTIEACA